MSNCSTVRTSRSMSSFSLIIFAWNSHTTRVSANERPVSSSSTHFNIPSLLYMVTLSTASPVGSFFSCLAAKTAASSACNSASSSSFSDSTSSAFLFLFPSFLPIVLDCHATDILTKQLTELAIDPAQTRFRWPVDVRTNVRTIVQRTQV